MYLRLSATSIVHRPDESVGPKVRPGGLGTEAIPETGLQDEVQSPAGLFHRTDMQLLVVLCLGSIGYLEEGIGDLASLQGLLRHIAGIVPATVEGEDMPVILSVQIGMAGAMLPRNRIAATLAEHEVDDTPCGVFPHVPVNIERLGTYGAYFQGVLSFLAEVREVEGAECPQSRLALLYGTFVYGLAGGIIDQAEMIAGSLYDGGLLAIGPVARRGVDDTSFGWLPAAHYLGVLYGLQPYVVHVEDEAVAHGLLFPKGLDSEGELGHFIASQLRHLHETEVPIDD